ncbi:SH3 domain-containing protein [Microbacterium sp.]|uniref:SH3 domain-containing protein n=1 Tax=Microbacterium sp. TaxID=51671 RepID=UPI003A8567C7
MNHRPWLRHVAVAAASLTIILGGLTPTAASAADAFVSPLGAKAYSVTSWYGPRCMPLPGGPTSHSGVDLGARAGEPIFAVAAGVVTETVDGSDRVNGKIAIRHEVGGETFVTKYVHMWSATTHVKVGQKVAAGQRISQVGTSGSSTGNHLHLEVWVDGRSARKTVDGVSFLAARGVDLVAGARSVTATAAPASCTYYTTGTVNLRSGPSTSTPIVVTMAKGTAVTAVPGQQSGSFLPVKAGSRSGWVANWLLTPQRPAPPAPVPAPVTYRTTANLNLRPGPSTSRPPLLVIPRGKSVGAVLAVDGAWRKVRYANTTGWVHADYLVRASAATAPAPSYVTTAPLNMRTAPSRSGTRILVIPRGKSVGVVRAANGEWRKVGYAGKTGWVHSDYLRKR